MDVSRRGFLLGAIKTGALAILPIPLLKAAPVEVPEIITPILDHGEGLIRTNMNLINVGSIERTLAVTKGDGIFFNNKLIPVQDMELSIYNDLMEFDNLRQHITFCVSGGPNMELRLDSVFVNDDPYNMFLNGDRIKVDILSKNTRYSGAFIIKEYTLSCGVH